METINNQFNLIEKEDISKFVFPKAEVLKDILAITERSSNIERGLKLGNALKNKVQIYFEDSESMKKVQTTIWGVTEKYLILKSNVLIPIERIHQVTF